VSAGKVCLLVIRTDKASTASKISSNIGTFLTSFSYLLILWFGAKLAINQQLTIGQLVAFQMLSARVTGPLLRLVQLLAKSPASSSFCRSSWDVLNVAPETELGVGLVLPPARSSYL